MRVVFLAACATAWAQIGGPQLGLVSDGSRVRALYGISGAASVGDPLDFGRDLVHVAVSRTYAIATAAENGDALLLVPGQPPRAVAAPGADRIAISPGGSSAALWYPATLHFQMITGLPASPVTEDVDATFLGAPKSFAVADNGILAGAWDTGVWTFSATGVTELRVDAAALAFFPGTDDLVFATPTRIYTQSKMLFDASDQRLSPAGLAASSDRIVLADVSGRIYSIDTDGAVAIVDCDCAPDGVFPLGGSLFRLTNVENGSARLFDASKNVMLYAPVMNPAKFGGCGVVEHRRGVDKIADAARTPGGGPHTGSACASMPLATSPPPLSIGGLPATSTLQQQLAMTISIPGAFSTDLSGTATLTFHSSSSGDDQMIQFSTGGRTVNFTIPAGATQATFGGKSSVNVLTGTVAGTITITANITTDIAPPPATATVTTSATAPVIDSVTLSQTSGGITVVVTGYTPTREVSSGVFSFSAGSGASIAQSTLTVPLTSAFASWFGNSASTAFGGEFTLTMPFTVQGNAANVVRVAVDLSNGVGVSAVSSSK